MRSTACDTVCALIDREAIGWSEAERLRVEQHLGECQECSESLSLSRFVRATLREAAGELPESARMRAIKNALSESAKRQPSIRVAKGLPRYALGLSLAAAAALLVWLVRTPLTQTAAVVSKPGAAAHEAALARAPATPKAQEPAPKAQEPALVESTGREQHTFAHATVTFAPATRARFDAATRTLFLEQGAIDVDVNPEAGASFSVVTESFRVEVMGTRFSMTPYAVTVQHGRVRVLGPTGVVLASALGKGETFTLASEAPSASKPGSKPESKPSKSGPKLPAKSAKQLLAEARGALYRSDAAGARALVGEAEKARPARADRAEAGTLRAEILMLERDHTAAVQAYRDVATHYAELAAGENASFAAAQLAVKVAPTKAHELLEAYLARYPHGRFESEVRERLRRLDAR
jgi:hypothetical protein